MKTTTFFMMLMMSIISWNLSASVQHVYLDNTYNPEYFYFCGIDSVIIHKPTTAINSIYWNPPVGPNTYDVDSVIVTSINTGTWSFYSDEVGKNFYVYFLTAGPVEPTCMLTDTSFCTATFSLPLDAENHLPGGHASTYLWSTGATTRTITATTPGIYSVTVTNACGSDVYTKNVYHANPNAPQLGADQTFCWGSSSVLDPLSTNVASWSWSTGETTPTITVDTTGTYWVYLVDNNGCSGRDTVQITSLLPIGEEICYVEFDTITWKNNINWTSVLPGNADSIRIYKETSLNVWTLIGTVGTTTTNFLDIASAPQAQSYSYRLAIVDTCGNESDMSSYHTTITLLSSYDSGTNTYGFTWSPYYGLTVADYYLFGIDASNNVTQIGTVPGNQFFYNYINPNLAYIKYFVGFETPDCNGAKANVIVKSNWIIKDPLITGIQDEVNIPFTIYPNPANDHLNLSIEKEVFDVQILSPLGQVLLTESNTKVLNISHLSPGMYIISVSADGITSKEKFFKY